MESEFCFLDTTTQRRIPLVDGMVFGRNSGDEQFPDDRKMSREHFKISIQGLEVFIKDLDSSNTTRVNQVPLPPMRPTPLRIHDVVEFGSQKFVFMFTKKLPKQVETPTPDQVARRESKSIRALSVSEKMDGKRLVDCFVRLRERVVSHFQSADRFVLGVVLTGLLIALAALYTAREGLANSQVYPGFVLGLEMFAVFGVAAMVSAYGVAKGSKRLAKRRALKPLLAIFAVPVFLICVELGKLLTGYPERLMANTIAHLCSSTEFSESCLWAAAHHPRAHELLPGELKVRLADAELVEE